MPLETVNTVVVQDREYGQDGKPLVNQEVTVRLAPAAIYLIAAGAAGNTDQVALQQTEMRTKTDSTGFWSVSLVSNAVITPANTYYSVKVGLLKTYDIAVPSGAGPFVASNILTGPLPVFPGGSSVAGPITITGNLAVTGTGTFSGALAANGGLAVLGGGNVAGGLTVAGLLTMSDAASRLVPGATSFSVRDTANANDNLIVTNAGNLTVRGNLTVSGGPLTVAAGGASITGGATVATGDLSISAGRLVLGAAVSKIVPGATSLSLRNNADSADNVLIADAGLVTLRNTLTLPVGGLVVAPAGAQGAPTAGTFAAGTVYVDSKMAVFVCSVAGTPGTWLLVSAGPYHAEVFRNAAQSIANGFVFATVAYDSLDSGGDPNSNFNTGTGVYTCPVAGVYRVSANVPFSVGAAGTAAATISKNGATDSRRLGTGYSGVSNPSADGSGKIRCAAGDTLAVQAAQSTTSNPAALAVGASNCWAQFELVEA